MSGERRKTASRLHQRRATGLVRSLVVAAATLSILLVCFSLYQYSQDEPKPAPQPPRPRLPSLDPEITKPGVPPSLRAAPGVQAAGAGRDIKLTLYPRRGSRAVVEVAVRSWTPVSGSTNEFLLVDPEIRMRTNDDRAVRVTADEGWLEARQKGSGSLDAERGRLTGSVVILIDRLTSKERALLPADQRKNLDPSQMVRVTAEQIEFDLEYSKLVVPRGGFHVHASDLDFRANDLEVRFNEEAGRIEYLRITGGGRIELNGLTDELGLEIPGITEQSAQRMSLVTWMRRTIQSVLDAQQPPEPQTESEEAPAVTIADDGTAIFRPGIKERPPQEAPIRYISRFEKKVHVRQLIGDTLVSHLEADQLSIRRAFSQEDRRRSRAPSASAGASDDSADPGPKRDERIVLEWAGRLVVEACREGDDRCNPDGQFDITAIGSPARLTSPDGEAVCRSLEFTPETDALRLLGSPRQPVVVRSHDQGTLTGVEITSERTGKTARVHVKGPGRLVRKGGAMRVEESAGASRDDGELVIDFAERLDVEARYVDRTWIDLTAGLSKKRFRVLDRASFFGNVALKVADTEVHADTLTVEFGTGWSGGSFEQTIDRVKARGHVVMTQGTDRIACSDMDLSLTADESGRVVPVTLTALGDVEVIQENRSIRAADKLIIDFESRRREPTNMVAVAASPVVPETQPALAHPENKTGPGRGDLGTGRDIVVKRLRGAGEVTVVDPDEGLDLQADRLDCTLIDGDRLDEVLVHGSEDQPASIRLDTFTVSGREISLDVRHERADVPGEGTMTFVSQRDLDGRKVDEPIPIAISWNEWMTYDGQENRAVLQGNVRATSNRTTTFECVRMEVGFEDVAPTVTKHQPAFDWGILQGLVDRLSNDRNAGRRLTTQAFSKQVTTILAKGQAVALTSDLDPATGRLKSRARISGHSLSVDLRPDVSKMLIEGAGDLLLEDFRPPRPRRDADRPVGGLFAIDEDTGPSKTLIRWQEMMSYDFSIDQVRFEGDVRLTHLSGTQLDRVFQSSTGDGSGNQADRATFLKCGLLTIDFLDRADGAPRREAQRMGRLSADRLRQFHASKDVELQDPTEGLALTADDLIFEKQRNILIVQGSPRARAHIVLARPGQFPREYEAERFFYDLKTNRAEASRARFRSR